MNMTEILNQAETAPLTKAQIVALLNTDNHSPAFYQLLSKANEMSRKTYGDKGKGCHLMVAGDHNCSDARLTAGTHGKAQHTQSVLRHG